MICKILGYWCIGQFKSMIFAHVSDRGSRGSRYGKVIRNTARIWRVPGKVQDVHLALGPQAAGESLRIRRPGGQGYAPDLRQAT